MTEIKAHLVMELRAKTDAPMMACKKALEKAGGDLAQAEEILRIEGSMKAEKKADRVTAEGTISVAANGTEAVVLVEQNCETDFVARQEKFLEFAKQAANFALTNNIADINELQNQLNANRLELVAQLGENVSLRKVAMLKANTGEIAVAYQHKDGNGVRVASAVVLKGGAESLARDLAMHVAAMKPQFLSVNEVPLAIREKEQQLFISQAQEEFPNKPEAMLSKIADGKYNKWLQEITLLGQNFVKENNKTVAEVLKAHQAELVSFVRLGVGEGVEKKADNFVAEVMNQVRDMSH